MSFSTYTVALTTLFLLHTTSANFTNAEFSASVAICTSKVISENFEVELPVNDIRAGFTNFDFESLKSLFESNNVPLPRKFKKPVYAKYLKCFNDYYVEANITKGLFAVLMDCQCVYIQDQTGTTPPCDLISDLAGIHKLYATPEIRWLYKEAGFELNNSNHTDYVGLQQCLNGFKSLMLKI